MWQSGYMLEKSPQLSCMGLQPIGPVRLDVDSRGLLVLSAYIDSSTQQSQRKLDYYCDHETKDPMKYDPRYLMHFRREEVEHGLALKEPNWIRSNLDGIGALKVSPLFHLFAHKEPYRQYCAANRSDLDEELCVYWLLTFQQFGMHDEWHGIPGDENKRDRWFGYNDPEFNENFEHDYLKPTARYLLYIGLLFYALKIEFDAQLTMAFAFAVNLTFLLLDFQRDYMFGVDTIGYLDQGSQFLLG